MNQDVCKQYIENGIVKINMNGKATLNKLRIALISELKKQLKEELESLGDIHNYCSDEIKEDLSWKMSEVFWSSNLYDEYIEENYSIIQNFIGSGVYVQAKPFLRIARPNRPDDNIGFHRDTVYNQSPHELSIHVPLLDLDKNSCMKFIPKSHLMPDSAFVFKDGIQVSKTSKKHKMGFPWLQKNIVNDSRLIPFPVNFGQAMFFSPSTVHGQENNIGKITRVSFDFRVVTEYAPDDILREDRNSNYKLFVRSPVNEVAYLFAKIR